MVLRGGSWSGDVFILPPGHIDRPLYEKIDKALRALGGKWSRAAKGHTFNRDAREALELALEAGAVVDIKKTLEQFFTPYEVAEQLAKAVRLTRGDYVLEPSAGAGALVNVAAARGCHVYAVEIDGLLAGDLARSLLNSADRSRFRVDCQDFMDWTPQRAARQDFDAVIMNPPFGGGADMEHVARAFGFLAPGGTLGAIMSPHWTFATTAKAKDFRSALSFVGSSNWDWTPLPEGSFRASGTNVSSGILVMKKGNI